MAQQGAPEDTFRTHLGVPSPALSQVAALNRAAWAEWQPFQGFPYQEGSGYGDLNDKIIPAPPGQYNTYTSLRQTGGNTAKVARQTQGLPQWYLNIVYWWKGKN